MISRSVQRRLAIQQKSKITKSDKLKAIAIVISIILIGLILICFASERVAAQTLPEKLATNKMQLIWTKSVENMAIYKVYVNSEYLLSVNHPDTSIVIKVDTLLARYYESMDFNVTATDSIGNESFFSNTETKLVCKETNKLYCDLDGDDAVINIDYFLMLRKLGNYVSVTDTILQIYDFNGDTLINNIDFAILLKRLGNRK